jgi:hypothetical protein
LPPRFAAASEDPIEASLAAGVQALAEAMRRAPPDAVGALAEAMRAAVAELTARRGRRA